jgi:hypothetical protein
MNDDHLVFILGDSLPTHTVVRRAADPEPCPLVHADGPVMVGDHPQVDHLHPHVPTPPQRLGE